MSKEFALAGNLQMKRARNVTAVLGPTNTGKTHLAIERMLGHDSGLIGLPLRLLAREVYDRIVARVPARDVALITGEEKIRPESARYTVCTVEAMPREPDVDFLAIDEVQLAADPERGHVFTDRLLHVRGKQETLLLGAQTMRDAIADIVPGANFVSRPRLSQLTYAGHKKLTRMPRRAAIVAFSAGEVYALAELVRRQRGGAAVVLGALSPRTRNAQVELYQSGEVDFLVATDAIGMGLNLKLEHVAFAGVRKYDGERYRNLTPAELAQIAGRAGRHLNDGTFGVTGDIQPFDSDLVECLENHTFETVRRVQWRTRNLDFSSLDNLRESLRRAPAEPRLTRARPADDVMALEAVCRDREIAELAANRDQIARLWEVCQVPDYRKISSQNHADLVDQLYKHLSSEDGRLPEDWFAKQVAFADRTDGDIDTLANRIAHIRTWTFVSNRADWLADAGHWQGRTREIEDRLSDALHEQLTQRFVDRRTSALMRGMRDKAELFAEISDDGGVHVEKHYVGRLNGFQFSPDTNSESEGIHGKAARSAAAYVLTKELAMRVRRVVAAKDDAFKLSRSGRILWKDEEIARLEASDDALKPTTVLLADDHLGAADREKVQDRLERWLGDTIGERLKPLVDIAKADDIAGLGRGIAFQVLENFGCLKREGVAEDVRGLDQAARAQLRKYGLRFGAFNLYFPSMLKPAASELGLTLWMLKAGPSHDLDVNAAPVAPRAGLTSLKVEVAVPEVYYRVAGFHVCGPRAVRIDMLERLADLIRPLLSWRSDKENSTPAPNGATGDGGFTAIPEMMSIMGCSAAELGHVLAALGFHCERRPIKARAATTEPAADTAQLVDAQGGTDATDKPAQAAEVSASDTPVAPAAEAVVDSEVASAASSTEDKSSPADAAETSAVDPSPVTPPTADPPKTDVANQAVIVKPEAKPDDGAAIAKADSAGDTKPDLPATSDVEPAKADQASASEPEREFEEVWRPRRRRNAGPRRPRKNVTRPGAGREQTSERSAAASPKSTGAGRRDKDDRRQSGDRDRRKKQSSPPAQNKTAGPARRFRKGPDPDSPFAALAKLKDELEDRT